MSTHQPGRRFFRPADVTGLRRNQRRIQVQRVLVIGRALLVIGALTLVGVQLWRHTQSDARFAVKTIGVDGATHIPRATIDAITRQYAGLNLFKIDIARVQHDLGGLPWVKRIAIEKQIPDTLRIRIVERTPVAILRRGKSLRYIDEGAVELGDVTPSIGDSDLPIIGDSDGAELLRSVQLVKNLRDHDPNLYARISEVRPIAPKGFMFFDRQLGTFVYANGDDLTAKWQNLYAIVKAEQFPAGGIEYADLRFSDRIIVRPLKPIAVMTQQQPLSNPGTQITN
jgi:cell division protein FtsQ